MKRRALLQLLSTFAIPVSRRMGAQAIMAPRDAILLRELADVVLPQELGSRGLDRAVAAFLTWTREYRAGAETDHGYGFPRLRRTPPSPATKYAAQLEALDQAARARGHSFADLPTEDRRRIVDTAIAAAKIERLPVRPDGGHIATDLMGFYFNSIDANDLAYRASIGRDTCRTLAGSENRPAPLNGGR